MEKTNEIIQVIEENFKRYVKDGLFNEKFIGPDREFYSGGRCHSRVLGILVQSFQIMGFITDIERRIMFSAEFDTSFEKPRQKGFRPDIAVVDKNDKIMGIIEFESIDASEEHLKLKIKYFEKAIPANPNIKFIIFFPTLTTLTKAPAKWIEKDRKVYVNMLTPEIEKLSADNPDIEFYFLSLNENGLTSRMIKGGKNLYEKQERIWELQPVNR